MKALMIIVFKKIQL